MTCIVGRTCETSMGEERGGWEPCETSTQIKFLPKKKKKSGKEENALDCSAFIKKFWQNFQYR